MRFNTYIDKIKSRISLERVTKLYLWWVVIRWFLRWIATALFLAWIWFLAPQHRKDAFVSRMKLRTYSIQIEWADRPMNFFIDNKHRRIIFGLREDNTIVWKEVNND